MTDPQNYHPSIGGLLRWFNEGHLAPDFLNLAIKIANTAVGPEAATAIRKLLEAMDAAGRGNAAVDSGPPKAQN